ncbi:MAG: hypothetical protein EAZ78_01330 [Oscillatoriales cyanobacterium]|nr:MAG: hypothetical protein EAZ78_01330 [Oscillatoriales cyanobacterium]TAF30564.1 MAG: hypothetical protein EAZ68_22655 [Oscillatoriales cyanobacterium]
MFKLPQKAFEVYKFKLRFIFFLFKHSLTNPVKPKKLEKVGTSSKSDAKPKKVAKSWKKFGIVTKIIPLSHL